MIGTVLDRKYRIVELIGTGGMAQVYRAINMSNRRPVAVKVLKEEYRDDAEFLRRFTREANAILTLSHENIVRAYGTGTHDGLPYLVMEYVEGRTLKDLIATNGALPVRTAIGITCQILDALSAAHAHGIIHRDVKPQNVIVTDKGRVKLADFGIAREAKATTVTFSGQKVLGSVHYISPEQAKGTIATEQSDLYSVGICLYEMLTGTVPFEADSTVTVALMHLQEKPVAPIDVKPDLPRSLNDIVLKAIEKSPENRYQTARAMRSDLVRSLSDPDGTFVNDPDDKGQKTIRRPSVYVLIAMCVFLPILLIGIFVLIYATSCRTELPDPVDPEDEVIIPITATPAPAVTPIPTTVVDSIQTIPNLVGYSLDDALRVLYYDNGFSNLIVEVVDRAPDDTQVNTIVSISASAEGAEVHFELPSPAPISLPDLLPAETPFAEIPELTPEATAAASDSQNSSETIIAETPAAPQEETVPVATPVPTVYLVESVDVTPTPEPSREPARSEALFRTDTPIRICVYRKSLGSYKADISFTFTLESDDPVNLVEIGYETTNIEDVPFRVILHSHERQNEKSELTETATVYGYEPVTRTLFLYINGEVRSAPQAVTFAK